jgi:hypothetical protein
MVKYTFTKSMGAAPWETVVGRVQAHAYAERECAWLSLCKDLKRQGREVPTKEMPTMAEMVGRAVQVASIKTRVESAPRFNASNKNVMNCF